MKIEKIAASRIKNKKCSKCKTIYPSSTDFFYKRTSSDDGLDFWCKKCKKNYDHKRNEALRLEKYHLTNKKYNDFIISQNNKCAICGVDFRSLRQKKTDIVPNTGKPRIDHDHFTGKVRGLLCSDCNIVIGCFKDNPLIILKAINYLRRHKK
jgi:hypothetical protein